MRQTRETAGIITADTSEGYIGRSSHLSLAVTTLTIEGVCGMEMTPASNPLHIEGTYHLDEQMRLWTSWKKEPTNRNPLSHSTDSENE
jgi:hypothetical protein